MQRLARETGDESDLAYLMTWLASIEILRGDLEAAVALADEAATHATLAGSEFNRAWALTQRAMALAYRGDADGAWASAGEAGKICARFEAGNPMLWGAAALAHARAVTRATPAAAWVGAGAGGRAGPHAPGEEAARDRARPGGRGADRRSASSTAPRRCLDRLRDARGAARPRLGDGREPARCRALLLAARGELADAHAATERALAEHERLTAPLERGRTLLVQGPDRAAAQAEARRP